MFEMEHRLACRGMENTHHEHWDMEEDQTCSKRSDVLRRMRTRVQHSMTACYNEDPRRSILSERSVHRRLACGFLERASIQCPGRLRVFARWGAH